MTKARELAYMALITTWEQGTFLRHFFEARRQQNQTSSLDLRLAQEIAYGCLRWEKGLEFIVHQLTGQKVTSQRKQRALLFSALYQLIFLDKLPSYAVVNETVALAKRHCHRSFASFLNASLRKVTGEGVPVLPYDSSLASWSTRFSMPSELIQEWVSHYGKEAALSILKAFQQPPLVFMRKREGERGTQALTDNETIEQLDRQGSWYIQNPTPYYLMEQLAQTISTPSAILDLCCAPGGKLIAAHDLFPQAKLVGNDISENKLSRIRQNFERLSISATLTQFRGEEFSLEQTFDLVIVDAPCSNTGVLHKKPEARKRGVPVELLELQEALLNRAGELLKPGGQIWYLTCSLSPQENERMTERFCQQYGFHKLRELTQLPNEAGWDGGYGCALIALPRGGV